MTPSVFTVGSNKAIEDMFRKQKWEVSQEIETASVVIFTGGEDVDPALYGELRHKKTFPNPRRDSEEAKVFHYAQELKIPCVGLCRGGQFLNVMCDGKLWQDVDGHRGNHWAFDLLNEATYQVTSTHHQMMIPGVGAQVVMIAWESKNRTTMKNGAALTVPSNKAWPDIEALLYKKQKVLCYQPHPEYAYCPALTVNRFFELVNSLLET